MNTKKQNRRPPVPQMTAFPGAEGFGAKATGGRGGRVIRVTTLAPTGPGSLQEALDQNEPRIIVFTVSGVIDMTLDPQTDGILKIPHGNVTVAGQTAPGAGITIKGRLYGAYNYKVGNIILRHLRIRPPTIKNGQDGEQFDALQFSRNHTLMFDHLSASFGVDETIDIYEARDVTIQWCSITMSDTGLHTEGQHNYGLINGPNGKRVSIHHNLFAHHMNRNPAIANGPCEIINNVIYNVRHGFVHHNPATGCFNIIGNYYKQGPNDSLIPFYFDDENTIADPSLSYYLHNNYIDDPGDYVGIVHNPWQPPFLHPSFNNQFTQKSAAHRRDAACDFSSIATWEAVTTHEPETACKLVLNQAGGFPRDCIDKLVVREANERSGSWGARIPPNLMDGLTPVAPYRDRDRDGMPDIWEATHGLNPFNPLDHFKLMPSGYTAIEEYINELAENLLATQPDNPDTTGFITYTHDFGATNGGRRVYRIPAKEGAQAEDISSILDRLCPGSSGNDRYLNSSPNGKWLILSTDRCGCDWECLVRLANKDNLADLTVSDIETIKLANGMAHTTGRAAIDNSGEVIVYSANGGSHVRDLWLLRKADKQWNPECLTENSDFDWHYYPSISPDGSRVVFEASHYDPLLPEDPDNPLSDPYESNSACEINLDGSGFRVILETGVDIKGIRTPCYEPDGKSIVLEIMRHGESEFIARIRPDSPNEQPERIGQFSNDNTPCVLPDGRIASLWIGREDGYGKHEIKMMNADGSESYLLVTVDNADEDISDIGCGTWA